MRVSPLLPRRSFERALRGAAAGGGARKLLYRRLAQVSIRHEYYNASEDSCPDFTVLPTPSTAALMQDLGLLFKAGRAGFSVLYDENSQANLLAYLRRQGELWEQEHEPQPTEPPRQVWTRLSFVLALANPLFVNFTAIPIGTNPTVRNFFFTNQEAHRRAGEVLLAPGRRVTGKQLLKVVPVQFPVELPEWAYEVQVFALSGEQVMTRPRQTAGGADRVFLDFSGLPEDKYSIVTKWMLPPFESSEEVLYTLPNPTPLGFVDLLLADPTGKGKGIYPVRDLWTDPRFVPVDYILRFENRSTLWNYYIVPPQWDAFTGLRIESEPPNAVEFDGPYRVRLPDGTRAHHFLSREPLPLQEQPEVRLRLLGRRPPAPYDRVLVDLLPVASPRQVLPRPHAGGDESPPGPPGRRNESDIYVYV